MKMCPNCRNQIADEAVYCPICGTGVGTAPQFTQQNASAPVTDFNTNYTQQPVYTASVPYVDPYDHTTDFAACDIAENKVVAMAAYLFGLFGILIALLAAKESKYTAFHVRQALKLTVAEALGSIALAIAAFLMWNLHMRGLMFFVVTIALIGLLVIHLLCVLQVINNKAKEVYIIRSFRFLK